MPLTRKGERVDEKVQAMDALDERRRFVDLKSLSLSLFGFAFVRAWDDLAIAQLAGAFPEYPSVGQDLVSAGMLPVFILLIVASRRIAPLYRHRSLVYGAPALMVAAVVVYGMAVASDEVSGPLVVAAALMAGVGAALSILQWAELQSCLNSLQIVLYVSGSFFLGSAASWLCLGLDGQRLAVVMVFLPVLSLLSLRVGFSNVSAVDLPKSSWGRLRFPWKLVIVLGIYEFVMGVIQGSSSFGDGTLVVGVLLASAVLFVLAFFFSHRFDFTRIYRTPFVFMVCGLLATLLSVSAHATIAYLLVSIGYALMFLLLTMLLCDISHRYGVSAALLCSIEEVVMLTSMGGHALSWISDRGMLAGVMDGEGAAVALTALVVIASVVLMSEREYSKWDASFFGVGQRDRERDRRAAFAQRCISVAERFHLSPREKEVFQLMAVGKSSSEIEGELYIANGTLKSHTRRIYQKIGVHSRSEMMALLDDDAA